MAITSEFTKLLSTKSMMRYLPPNGTAGLVRKSVSGANRSPRPPAMIMARMRGWEMRTMPESSDEGGAADCERSVALLCAVTGRRVNRGKRRHAGRRGPSERAASTTPDHVQGGPARRGVDHCTEGWCRRGELNPHE